MVLKLLQEKIKHSTRFSLFKGITKMYINKKITSKRILGQIMLLYFHPDLDGMENNDIRHCLAFVSFYYYPKLVNYIFILFDAHWRKLELTTFSG